MLHEFWADSLPTALLYIIVLLRLLESTRANARNSDNSRASQEQDDDRTVDRDETDPYNEVIFGRRRPDSVAIEWTSKTVYVLEFKRTSDQRQDYRERGESRAPGQKP